MKTVSKKVIWGLLFVVFLVVSLPAIGNTIYYQAPHDTLFHTQRILSVSKALEHGQFPVRVFGDQLGGYGYGTPLFYSSFFLIFPALLYNMGLSLVWSYNIFLITINACTLLLAYFSFRTITKSSQVGCIAAILYTVCTYRLEDVYVRGSMGEFLALIFLPLCLCGLIAVARGEYGKWYYIALGFSGVLQSHTLSFLMIAAIAVVYAIFYRKGFWNKKAIIAIGKAAGLFLLLNLWYLVPFLDAYRMPLNVKKENTAFWLTDASLTQLFDVLKLSVNGAEVFGGVNTNSMPKTPGAALLVGAILAVFGLVICSEEKKKTLDACKWYLLPGLLFTWMTTNLFPWKLIQHIPVVSKFFSSFQFMWRFNIVGILFLSIVAGYGFYYFFVEDAGSRVKAYALLGLVLGFSGLIFINQLQKNVGQYGEAHVIENGQIDYLYLTENERIPEVKTVQAVDAESFRYTNRRDGYLKCEFDFTASETSEWGIELPFVYYPGYQVKVNGKKVPVAVCENGQVKAVMSPDMTEGTVSVYYGESSYILVSDLISLFTLCVCLFFGIRKRFGKRAVS